MLFGMMAWVFAQAQSDIYISNEQRRISIVTIGSGGCSQEVQVTTSVSLSDIALHPNGRMYGVNFSRRAVYEVDMVTGNVSEIVTIPDADALVGLTADANGVLYAVEGNVVPSRLYTVNVNNNTYEEKGLLLEGSAGDLTWNGGRLYNASDNNKLVEVNIDNPEASSVIGTFDGVVKPGDRMFALVSVSPACDETITYGLSEFGDYYIIDLETARVERLCIGSVDLYGATSADEFLASACTAVIDLDADNSSGLPGSEFQEVFDCASASAPVADEDADIRVTATVNSLRLRLTGSMPDGTAEFLEAGEVTGISLSGTGPEIVAVNDGGVPAAAFETWMGTVRYRNTQSPPTPGQRTVEVVLFSGGVSDTAYAYIYFEPVTAGVDGTITACPAGGIIDLFAALGGSPREGGEWQPEPSAGPGLFDPAVDAPGIYAYIATDGCVSDTAYVTVSPAGPIALDLGPDRTICAGEQTVLSSGYSTSQFNHSWNTGSNNSSIQTSSPGLYILSLSDGCSVAVDSLNIFTEPCDTTGPETDTTQQPVPGPEPTTCELLLPTAFTPNGDGVNDVFGVVNTCEGAEAWTLRIYNRYGELIFEGPPLQPWDGTYQGRKVPLDTYVWYLDRPDPARGLRRQTGTVVVLH